MSPLLDLQRRLTEVGRIRIGALAKTKSGKLAPKKLAAFRLTSPSQDLLNVAASLYGGTVNGWEGAPGEQPQYELFTETNVLEVIFPPGQSLSQHWELWSGGGCLRRCDGRQEYIGDTNCVCPAAYDERRDQAANGKACKPTTRLNVILRQVPGIGVWRLETHGYYAAVELAGTAELCELATSQGRLIPARLRLERRTVRRPGQPPFHFAVPVIDVDAAFGQILETLGLAPGDTMTAQPQPLSEPAPAPALAAVPTDPDPDPPAATTDGQRPLEMDADKARTAAQRPTLEGGLDKVDKAAGKRGVSKAKAAIPPPPPLPADATLTIDTGTPDDGPPMPQDELIAMKAREAGIVDDDLRHDFIGAATGTGARSAKTLTPREVKTVLDAIARYRAGTLQLTYGPDRAPLLTEKGAS